MPNVLLVIPQTAKSRGNFTDTIAGMNVAADIDWEGMYPYDFSQADVATTTYGYDAFGARVLQTGTSTTFIYPSKFYSIASSTVSGAKYATTTEYVFNGDTLLSTVDQQVASGVATGSPQARYIHPDHLGSTNVVTDQNGALVQTLDYYPYGATRISVATSTNERRQFIGQFSDMSNLMYLNARYMDPSRGQFLSEEPIFLNIGDATQVKQLSQQDQQAYLTDPQQLNSYSYGRDNPITRKDPNGKQVQILAALGFSADAVAAISYALDAYGTANLGVDAYNTYNTFKYTGGYTPTEKRQIYGQAVWDVVTGGSAKLAKPIERSNLDTLSAALDALNAASGGTVFDGQPQTAKNAAYPRFPIALIGTVNSNIQWSNYRTTQLQSAPSSRAPQAGSATNSGYSAFVGLLNPFSPIIKPLTPSGQSSQQK